MAATRLVRHLALGATATITLVACCHGIRRQAETPLPHAVAPGDAGVQTGVADADPDSAAATLLAPLRVVLADPRLGSLKEPGVADAGASAATTMDRIRKEASLSPHDQCTWTYEVGRLYSMAGDFATSAERFDDVATREPGGCPLVGYALFRSGEALVRAGRGEAALERLRKVPENLPIRREVDVTLANTLFALGDKSEAAALFDRILSDQPHGTRWPEAASHLSALLADEITNETSLKRALELTTRVVVEAPRSAEALGTAAVRSRAIKALRARGKGASEKLSAEELARQAKGWEDEGDQKRAIAAAELVVRGGVASGAPALCQALLVLAETAPRTKSDEMWSSAIKGCKGREESALPLYRGARSSFANHRPAEALDRFAELERAFPKHRLADDSRLRRAMIQLDDGKPDLALPLLDSLSATYPEGDMRADAEFRAGLVRFTRGDFAGAEISFDRSIAENQKDRHWASAGRGAYFRAMTSLARSDRAEAVHRLVAVVATYPLTYSMVLAWNRLRILDPDAARKALAELDLAPPGATRTIEPDTSDPRLARFVALLEGGDREAARMEASAIDATAGDDGTLPWLVGHYYNEAELPELGHVVGRTRTDYLAAGPRGSFRFAWEVAFPRVFPGKVEEASRAGGVSASLVWGIMREESAFRADAKSGANAHGLMQLIPSTARIAAKDTGIPSDLTALDRPEVSIALGARVLGGTARGMPQLPFIIASYNAGEGATRHWVAQSPATVEMDVWVEQIPYEETRGYVKRVIASMAAYAFLYDRAHFEETMTIPLSIR